MAKKSMDKEGINQADVDILDGWIPREYIQTFSEYKYKSPHKTYLEGVILDVFWEWIWNFVPKYVAPNLITAIGLVAIFIGMIPLVIDDPMITNQVSSWIYVYIAFSIWFYQTMDCIDGKQARRTGTSSVLGELFDHGWDAITWAIMTLIYSYIFTYGSSFGTCLAIAFQLGIFCLFTFEKRFTYELRTAMGEFGTIEAHYLYILFILLRAYLGPSFAFAKIDFLSEIFGFDFNLRNVAIVIGLGMTFSTVVLTFYTSLSKCDNSNDRSYCFQYMAYLILIFSLVLVILPTHKIFELHPVPWMIIFFCPLIKVWWKFIITSILKFHFNIFTWDQMLPVISSVLFLTIDKVLPAEKSNLSVILSQLVLVVITAASVIHLSLFAYGTVNQIAAHLKISVFKIKPKL